MVSIVVMNFCKVFPLTFSGIVANIFQCKIIPVYSFLLSRNESCMTGVNDMILCLVHGERSLQQLAVHP